MKEPEAWIAYSHPTSQEQAVTSNINRTAYRDQIQAKYLV